MKALVTSFVLLALIGGVIAAGGVVEQLTDESFEKIHHGVWFVKFFVPWCGSCRTLEPQWKNLAAVAADRYNVAEVDCGEQSSLCSDVRFYPTLRLFIEGQDNPIVYTGERSVEAMNFFVEYEADVPESEDDKTTDKLLRKAELLMQHAEGSVYLFENSVSRLEDAVFSRENRVVQHNFEKRGRNTKVELISSKDFDRLYHGAWIVRFYSSKVTDEESMTALWDEMAEKYGTMFHVAEIDCAIDAEICKLEKTTKYPSFVLYLDGTIGPSTFDGKNTIDEISKFVLENIEAVKEDYDDPIMDEMETLQQYMDLFAEEEEKEQKQEL